MNTKIYIIMMISGVVICSMLLMLTEERFTAQDIQEECDVYNIFDYNVTCVTKSSWNVERGCFLSINEKPNIPCKYINLK